MATKEWREASQLSPRSNGHTAFFHVENAACCCRESFEGNVRDHTNLQLFTFANVNFSTPTQKLPSNLFYTTSRIADMQHFTNGSQTASHYGRRSGAQRGISENTSARGLSGCPFAFCIDCLNTPLCSRTALPHE
jgi:hypothetical protein